MGAFYLRVIRKHAARLAGGGFGNRSMSNASANNRSSSPGIRPGESRDGPLKLIQGSSALGP